MNQAISPHQEDLRHVRERRQGENLDPYVDVHTGSHHQEALHPGRLALHFVTGIFSHAVRENPFNQGSFHQQSYPGG